MLEKRLLPSYKLYCGTATVQLRNLQEVQNSNSFAMLSNWIRYVSLLLKMHSKVCRRSWVANSSQKYRRPWHNLTLVRLYEKLASKTSIMIFFRNHQHLSICIWTYSTRGMYSKLANSSRRVYSATCCVHNVFDTPSIAQPTAAARWLGLLACLLPAVSAAGQPRRQMVSYAMQEIGRDTHVLNTHSGCK